MILLPAIDLKDGQCVRLVKGDYKTARRVADDAVETACSFRKAGAEWLHVVDLDGAKAGRPVHSDLMFRILKESGLRMETGGGIRDMETIRFYLDHGISRVILGTAAIGRPELVASAVRQYGEKIAVGIDARNGMAARRGWTETAFVNYLSLAKQMEHLNVKYLIFTDIARDGTLAGPNLEMLKCLQNSVSCKIIASGGVRGMQDLFDLSALGLYGAICGKSLYAGTLDLKAAVAFCAGGRAKGESKP